ncbi:hypothetical protein D5F42_04185 [Escherichia coli]|nr:hypothetical protein [Escherichia coli]OYK45538.1 hypothetical protein CI716_14005 [Escherichia coli]
MFLIVIVINENVFHDFIALITILFVTVSLWQKKPARGGQRMLACVEHYGIINNFCVLKSPPF